MDRHARNLALLHEFLQHEQEFLGALDGKGRHYHAAAALQGRANHRGHLRARIVMGMLAVAVRALHHQQVAVFALGGSGVHNLAGRDLVVMNPADVSGEQQLRGFAIQVERDLSHRRAQDVCRPHEAEGELVIQPGGLAVVDGLKVSKAVLRLLHGVERQRGRVLGRARLVVVGCVFFL